jgi:gamma-glutamyltranspeptidase/glutathione hydrolase
LHGPDAALTVAGAVAGWGLGLELARALGGQLPLDMLLSDAVAAAREGYAVSRSEIRAGLETDLLAAPHFSATFLGDDGKPAAAGSIRRQPRLADTLERLAHAGLMDFYRGDVGREIALDLERLGSPILRRDIETYRARVVNPLSVRLRQAEIFALPPPTQGLTALATLGIADRSGASSGGNADDYHRMIEAWKRAVAATAPFITDPREIEGDPADLLASHFLEHEALQIDRRRAATFSPPPDRAGGGIWLGCIDKDGLAVSYAQSVYGTFGSGCVLPATGVHWHNRGAAFSLGPRSRNPLEPGGRPPHALNPALAVLADNRVLAFGSVGTEIQAQIYSHYDDLGTSLADAVDAPRWKVTPGSEGAVLRVEERFDPGLLRALRQRGHEVEEIGSDYADEMGQAGMIVKHARNGRVEAIHDPRGDGAAMGL